METSHIPAVSYFIVCRKGFKDAARNIHKVLHEAETEVEIKELKTGKQNKGREKDVLSKLCRVLKDHNSSYAEGLLKYSVELCYSQAIRHNLEESSDEEKRKLFPFLSSSADDTSLKNSKGPHEIMCNRHGRLCRRNCSSNQKSQERWT